MICANKVEYIFNIVHSQWTKNNYESMATINLFHIIPIDPKKNP
jgi:hypothetical protein